MLFSDRVLAEGLLLGDPKAFHLMFETFFPRVFNYTFFHLAHHHKAENVTEQILTEAVETIGEYHATAVCSLTEWLFSITRRHIREMELKQAAVRRGRLTPKGNHTEFFRLEELLLESIARN